MIVRYVPSFNQKLVGIESQSHASFIQRAFLFPSIDPTRRRDINSDAAQPSIPKAKNHIAANFIRSYNLRFHTVDWINRWFLNVPRASNWFRVLLCDYLSPLSLRDRRFRRITSAEQRKTKEEFDSERSERHGYAAEGLR